MVNTLVNLVQSTYGDELSTREQMGLVRLEQTWRQRTTRAERAERPWPFAIRTLAAALALAALVPAGLLAYRHFAHVTYQVVNGTVGPEGFIQQTRPGTATVVVFSEGSQIGLDAAARARIASMSAEGGRVVLENGDAAVEIAHRPRAHWTVEAGPYSIRVTGTAFDVRWSSVEDRLDCRMKHGSVVITGPLVPAGVTLNAGMRFVASPRAGQATIGQAGSVVAAGGPRTAGAPPATEPAPPATGGSTPVEDATMPDEAAPRRRGVRAGGAATRREAARKGAAAALLATEPRRAGTEPRGWSGLIARGDFHGVLSQADAEGLDHVLESAPAGDLSALADAGRYTHSDAVARRALLALRGRLPAAKESRDSAFFLGGLAEGNASGLAAAIDWYDLYLRECPTGRFLDEAWGRKVVLTNKLRGPSAARPIAEEYLRRFPQGTYAAAARKLSQAR